LLVLKYSLGKSVTNRLVQDSRHAIYQELEVLWTMQATKEMPKEVLRCWAIARLRYGVQYQYQE
jgi:hypothetical protein